jgi:hypothetical protein
MLMKGIALTAVLALTTSMAAAKEYVIDDYTFTWTAAESGDASLLLQKTHDSLKVILRKKLGYSFDSLYLSPDEAENIGQVLSRVNEFYKKQSGSKTDTSDSVTVGDYIVSFDTSRKHGFSVIVRQTGRFSMSTLLLDRKEALGLSKELRDVKDKAAFVENSIAF